MERIYMDNAATTALSPKAAAAMTAAFANYGNPSSLHTEGVNAWRALEAARQEIASCIGALPEEVYFTSGGSESDNWALKGVAYAAARKGNKHIVSTTIEHHAVLHTLDALKKRGFEYTLVPVNGDGFVSVDDIANAIRPDTALVSVMYANNEIGSIQPISELAAMCAARGVIFHTDAVQAAGHLPIDAHAQNVDLMSISAHKFGGPNGIGALYIRRGVVLDNLIDGGAQERRRRAGTESVALAAGMAAALRESVDNMAENTARETAVRDRLIDGLLRIDRSRLNGGRENRLPGNVSVCFEGVEGESLLLGLDLLGIAASSGSACTSGSLDPSHVLLALGLPKEVAHGSLRLSLCGGNTLEEADRVLGVIPGVIEKLRDMSPVWERIMKGDQYGIQ